MGYIPYMITHNTGAIIERRCQIVTLVLLCTLHDMNWKALSDITVHLPRYTAHITRYNLPSLELYICKDLFHDKNTETQSLRKSISESWLHLQLRYEMFSFITAFTVRVSSFVIHVCLSLLSTSVLLRKIGVVNMIIQLFFDCITGLVALSL